MRIGILIGIPTMPVVASGGGGGGPPPAGYRSPLWILGIGAA